MSSDVIVLYQDSEKKFRWRRVAGNGQNVASPGQGYTRKFTALEAALSRNTDINPNHVFYEVRTEDGVRRELIESVLIDRYLKTNFTIEKWTEELSAEDGG